MVKIMNKRCTYFLIAITFILISFFGMKYSQDPFRILPLYVSIVVMLLQTRVNRYAFLIGGLNSILYAVVYCCYKLYASAINALCISCTMQIVTFINWGKNPYKDNSTVFRELGTKKRMLYSILFAVMWFVCYNVFKHMGSNKTMLDNTIMLTGISTTLLTMFSYVEWVYMQNIGIILNLIMYSSMIKENPEMSAYLVSMIYSLISAIITFIKVNKLYKEQKTEGISIGHCV